MALEVVSQMVLVELRTAAAADETVRVAAGFERKRFGEEEEGWRLRIVPVVEEGKAKGNQRTTVLTAGYSLELRS
jgi:hypothetical protein